MHCFVAYRAYSYTDGEKRERKERREKLVLYSTDAAAADAGSLHFSLGHIVYIFFPSQLLFILQQQRSTHRCAGSTGLLSAFPIINRPSTSAKERTFYTFCWGCCCCRMCIIGYQQPKVQQQQQLGMSPTFTRHRSAQQQHLRLLLLDIYIHF
jgi:hypothetical protein